MKIKSLIILTLLSTRLFSQNLVNNPGFEKNRGNPNTINELRLAIGWSNCNSSYGLTNSYGTPDYLSTLGGGLVQLPDCQDGYVYPYAGNCIMAEVTYDGEAVNYREYASTFLTSSLVVGRTYIVSFYTSIGDSFQTVEYISNNIGILFSVDSIIQPNEDGIVPRTPQINMAKVVSPNRWEQYSFAFKADSAYNYITIGNFYDDASTTLKDTFNGSNPYAYYFFDNFSVIPIDVSNDTTICMGNSITLSARGFSSYAWSTTSNPSVFSTDSVVTVIPTTSTNYIMSGNGIHDTIKVTVNPPPVLSITPSSPQICVGQSIPLSVSGASTYHWSPSTGLSKTTGSAITANPTINTTYTAYGTNSSGCNDSTKTTVVVNPLPVLTVSPSPAKICFRQTSAQLTVSGASSYTWSPSRGLSATTGSSVIANPTLTTTYTITGTNANQCTSTTTVVVIVDPLPVVSVTPSSPQICYGQSVALTASGAVNYQWSPSTALSSTTGVSIIANPTSTTTYTLLGTTSSGCSDSTAFTLKVNPLPVMSVTAAAPQICIGQSVKIKSSGASTYIWSPSTGLSATTGSLVTANPTVTTTYTVTGTSSFGCIDSTTTTIIVNPLPIITITPPDTALCHGYSATLKARGASTYQWIPARGLSSNSDSIVVATPSINTTYRVNGTSSFGCIDSTNIAIRVVQDSLKVSTNNTSICQGNSVVLTASGAYSYNWSPSTGLSATTGDTVTANPTLTTSYTLIATGAIGCLDTQKIVVTVNLPPVLTITPSSPQICIGHPTALKVSGAATYTWIPSVGLTATTGSSVTANPTVTTTYTSYGIDKHGCNDSSKVVVKVNPLPIVTVAPLDSLVCNGLSVPLTATGASAYKWSPAAGLNSTTDSDVVAAPLATTTYTVYGTDILGCTDTVTTVVRIIANSLKISVYPTNSIICLGNSAFITATGAKSYTWSPAIGINTTTGDTLTANPVSTTTYTVIGTGLGDCADTTVAVIIVSPPPVITVQPDSPVICYGQAIPLTASGASTYLWSPSTGLYETTGSQVDAHSSVTTLYTVYGRDSLKCIDSTKLTLIVKSSPVSSFTTSVPSICNPLQIQFSNISTAAVSYLWNFGDGDSSTEQNPVHLFPKTSIYTITLISTSENGCMDTLITADTLSNAHSNLFVANSFTPSIPGMNQIFKPDIICTAPSNYTFKIYNRWGEMVFETNDPKQGWDGTYKGKLQPLGSYVYFLQVNCGVCNFFKKGDVTLIR